MFSKMVSSIIQGNNKTTVTMNGRTVVIEGSNVSVTNGKIYVDGKPLDLDDFSSKPISIEINGNVDHLEVEGPVTVNGECGSVRCSGSFHGRDIKGNVDCMGSCHCGNVSGDVKAMGSVNHF